MSKVIHIPSGIEHVVVTDDRYGFGQGTVELQDLETGEHHVMGGQEFEMEYEAIK